MQIQAVSEKDQAEQVERLAVEIWNPHFIPIIGKAQVDYMLAKYQSRAAISEQIKNGCLYFLFRERDRAIGYMAVIPQADRLFPGKLYILASERGKGYGRKAIAFLETLAAEKGACGISLTVNRHNSDTIKAYEILGFTRSERLSRILAAVS